MCGLRTTPTGEDIHRHLLVHHPPTVDLSRLVTSLKDVFSRVLGRDYWPQVPTMLWGEHFWSPSCFAGSVGGPPLSVVQDYIESQKHPG